MNRIALGIVLSALLAGCSGATADLGSVEKAQVGRDNTAANYQTKFQDNGPGKPFGQGKPDIRVPVYQARKPKDLKITETEALDKASKGLAHIPSDVGATLLVKKQCNLREAAKLVPPTGGLVTSDQIDDDPVWVVRYSGQFTDRLTGKKYQHATFFVDGNDGSIFSRMLDTPVQ